MKLRYSILLKSDSLGGDMSVVYFEVYSEMLHVKTEIVLCLCVALLCNLAPIVIFPLCFEINHNVSKIITCRLMWQGMGQTCRKKGGVRDVVRI